MLASGAEFCKILGNGANVAVLDLDAANANKLSKKLKSQFQIAFSKELVVTLRTSMRLKGCCKGSRELGRIDILVNNAATKTDDLVSFFESFENYSLDTWKEVMSVNVDAMFLTAKAVGKIMVGDKMGGSIVQIASIYGLVGTDASIYEGSKYLGCQINTPAVYSTSKAAVLGLTKYLSTGWGNSGIRVNSISLRFQ